MLTLAGFVSALQEELPIYLAIYDVEPHWVLLQRKPEPLVSALTLRVAEMLSLKLIMTSSSVVVGKRQPVPLFEQPFTALIWLIPPIEPF